MPLKEKKHKEFPCPTCKGGRDAYFEERCGRCGGNDFITIGSKQHQQMVKYNIEEMLWKLCPFKGGYITKEAWEKMEGAYDILVTTFSDPNSFCEFPPCIVCGTQYDDTQSEFPEYMMYGCCSDDCCKIERESWRDKMPWLFENSVGMFDRDV